eukprot:scaffold2751_cov344-Prasinococcus_capsulatus_cf.AAC.11
MHWCITKSGGDGRWQVTRMRRTRTMCRRFRSRRCSTGSRSTAPWHATPPATRRMTTTRATAMTRTRTHRTWK